MAARERLAYFFGRRLRALREARGITAAELARLVGVTASWISHLERGRSAPNFALLARTAEVFSVEVVDLFIFPETTPRHRVMDALGPASFSTLDRLEKELAEQALKELAEKAPPEAPPKRGAR